MYVTRMEEVFFVNANQTDELIITNQHSKD